MENLTPEDWIARWYWQAADWARWMVQRLEAGNHKLIVQSTIAQEIHRRAPAGNASLCYLDKNGNLRIGKAVLREFRRLTPHVVYSRSSKYWSKRSRYDVPGRQQE